MKIEVRYTLEDLGSLLESHLDDCLNSVDMGESSVYSSTSVSVTEVGGEWVATIEMEHEEGPELLEWEVTDEVRQTTDGSDFTVWVSL